MEGQRIAVIGGGIGGYSAAIRAAQLGARVTLVEKDKLGGTCLNRGCIPTKSLLHSANLLWEIEAGAECGVHAGGVTFDYGMARKRTARIVDQLVKGLEMLMVKNRIKIVRGAADVINARKVAIADTGENINVDALIVATGSESKSPPVEGLSGPRVLDSTGALSVRQLPRSAVIIGGGAIGIEFAQLWQRLGVQVTVVEMMPQILPGEDAEIARLLAARLQEEGIRIYVDAQVRKIVHRKNSGTVHFDAAGEAHQVSGERVLAAAGRSPYFGGLNLDSLGVQVQNGAIAVDDRMATTAPGIYAAGDVVGGFMLAHVATHEGRCAAENATGGNSILDLSAVPRCVYTSPEVASVGLTEVEAKEQYDRVQVGRFPFRANGRSMVLGGAAGMVKIVADARYGEILGVSILGPCASELIAEAVLAKRLEATYKDLAQAIHAHPTLSEAAMEAALGVDGLSLHI